MLQIKLPRSSTIFSKRINRQTKFTSDKLVKITKRILPLVLVFFVVFFANSLFIIKRNECYLNSQPCPSEVLTVIDRNIGSNSLFINQKELIMNIKKAYPVDKITVGFKAFNTFEVKLQGIRPFVTADVYLVKDLPVLSMDQAPSTTDSASWWIRPTTELDNYVKVREASGFNLWDNGTMTSEATIGAKLKYIFSEKPEPQTISSIFKLIQLTTKYVDASNIYIVNNRCFLSRSGEPDIIVLVPFDEAKLTSALQSLSYLATIKKDTKVIDLSFKNPILK